MNGKKSTALYSAAKERIPNVIISACFKKHFYEIINERRQNEEYSSLFFFLPSITERKEKVRLLRANCDLNIWYGIIECY